MIIWVRGNSVGYPNDQRARVVQVFGIERGAPSIYVQLLGCKEYCTILPNMIAGIEFSRELTVKMTYTSQIVMRRKR